MAVIQNKDQQHELVLRLRRIEGQLRGIQAMIEKGADCEKITQQLSASRRALDKAFFQVLACAIRTVPGGAARSAAERIDHAAKLLAKFG